MVHDVAEFLGRHAPFDALDDDALAVVAAAAEIEFRAAGTSLLTQGADPPDHVWVVRSGSVELLDGGRALDLLGEGEMVGHPSMLSGLPAGFEARAHDDVLLYRLPAEIVAPVLGRPAGLRFVARTLRERSVAAATAGDEPGPRNADAAFRPVGSMLRGAAVVCAPGTPISEAAAQMTAAGATALVVRMGGGELGIVTDRDLRSRVATGEVPVHAPVADVMTPGAYTVVPERLGGEALIEMLDRGVRHAPVVDSGGRVLGVLDDLDLIATESRTPFHLRRAIADARSVDELASVARALPGMITALFDSRLAPERICAVTAVVVDVLTRRLIELAEAELPPAPVPFSWLALGSIGRREALPSSDADTGLVWHGDEDPDTAAWMSTLAAQVMNGLARCGIAGDANGVRADRPLFARSAGAWRAALADWVADPGQEQAVIAVSVLFDGRVIWGTGRGREVAPLLAPEVRRPQLVRLLARLALAHRPPTGFRGALVVEHSGEHEGTLDLKRGGVLPIADLARWAATAAGSPEGSTVSRLRAAARAGTLSATDARTLEEAWDLVVGLRLEHQVEQLRRGESPDDRLDPATLNPLTRRYLREAFRAVASLQRGVANELSFGTGPLG